MSFPSEAEVMSEHNGSIPSSIEALRRIPGVGPYTAGAIASIALGKAEALVDGNLGKKAAQKNDKNHPILAISDNYVGCLLISYWWNNDLE